MKHLVFIALLLLSLPLAAKKAPKWKDGNFKTTASGLQYKIVKEGKAIMFRTNDAVEAEIFPYKRIGKSLKFVKDSVYSDFGYFLIVDEDIPPGIIEAAKLLKDGGKGFFIIPPARSGSSDSLFCFIRVKRIMHMRLDAFGTADTIRDDSIHIVINDPNKKYFGDTLFSVMKLVEQPQIVSCGSVKVLIAFKFEITYFENGMQHKNILIFIECPDAYGENYFVAGTSYVVTCVPLLDDLKAGVRTMNNYSLQKLDSYYGLRVRKM